MARLSTILDKICRRSKHYILRHSRVLINKTFSMPMSEPNNKLTILEIRRVVIISNEYFVNAKCVNIIGEYIDAIIPYENIIKYKNNISFGIGEIYYKKYV